MIFKCCGYQQLKLDIDTLFLKKGKKYVLFSVKKFFSKCDYHADCHHFFAKVKVIEES